MTAADHPAISTAKNKLKELLERLRSHVSDTATLQAATSELNAVDVLLQRVLDKGKKEDGPFVYEWSTITDRLKNLVPRLIVNY